MTTRARGTRKLTMLAAAVLVGISAPSAAVVADTSEREAATLQRDVDALRVTGATGVLAEVSGARRPLAARAGVADPATGEPVPWHAKHRIASTTKTFVATVVLQLVAEGEIGLDDTVERWLPGLVAANGNDGTKITVRHLLGQKSGLPDYLGDLPPARS
jgi:D-alanyl-D-alanine carboxypeptidase